MQRIENASPPASSLPEPRPDPQVIQDEIEDDEQLDDPDPDDDEDLAGDEEEEAVAPPPRPARVARRPNPAHRQPVVKPDCGTSWWLGKDRDDFSKTVAERADDLRKSPEAAKVKTPVNFVS